jgi:hypothetical protein
MSSNWSNLKSKISSTADPHKRKRTEISDAARVTLPEIKEIAVAKDTLSASQKAKYIALDCEMVGIGPSGKQSALARCSIVDYDGAVLYDEHVRPPVFVTDFRTKYSGIRKHDLRVGHAISLADVRLVFLLSNQVCFVSCDNAVSEGGCCNVKRKNSCWSWSLQRFRRINAQSS